MEKTLSNNQQKMESRKLMYRLARSILKKKNATSKEIQECLALMPISGNKALALRIRLKRKLQGLSHSWDSSTD